MKSLELNIYIFFFKLLFLVLDLKILFFKYGKLGRSVFTDCHDYCTWCSIEQGTLEWMLESMTQNNANRIPLCPIDLGVATLTWLSKTNKKINDWIVENKQQQHAWVAFHHQPDDSSFSHEREEKKTETEEKVINRTTNSSGSKFVSVNNVNNLNIISFAPKAVLACTAK